MSFAQRERHQLVAAMAQAGPDAPTLCGAWTVRDLAAHLVVRERRPDTAPGIMISALGWYTERVRTRTAKQPFGELLEQVRTGPPAWSPFWAVDSVLNLTEMFVHHEDVRRGGADWEPRLLDRRDQAKLWSAVKRTAKVSYRHAPVTVVLESHTGDRNVAHKSGGGEVVLSGPPSELLLHAFGRDRVRIDTSGDPSAVRSVLSLDRSV